MKRLKRWLLGLLVILIAIVTIGGLMTVFTPIPASLLVRKIFDGGMAIAPENYVEIAARVKVVEDVDYESKYKSGTLDVFSPEGNTKLLPTILWVHGGAFVGGDKDDVDEYATQIAEKGFHVISMNYALAPETTYPTQVKQIAEVYQFLQKRSAEYNLDMNQVFLAGDSAGAHMVAQFAMIQTNPEYAKTMKIEGVMDPATISGTLLLCGPYDLMKFTDIADGSKVLDFFIGRIAWAYIGEKDWISNPDFAPLSIVDHVNKDFPTSFIMDGTTNTFTDHGKLLATKLSSLGVDVSTVFYDEEGLELKHEYQFEMNNEYSVNTFNKLVEFLETHSN